MDKLQNEKDDFALDGLHICYTLGAGIICLSETNTNWNQSYQITRVHNIAKDIWQTSAIQPSQHPESFSSQSQRGGTLQILTDRWVSRLQAKGVDPYGLGRWSYMTLQGKGNRLITAITAYRVCKPSIDGTGDTTAYQQQFRSILSSYNDKGMYNTPEPHRQFVLDLQSWIEHLQIQGHSIIHSLDGNEDITSSAPAFHP